MPLPDKVMEDGFRLRYDDYYDSTTYTYDQPFESYSIRARGGGRVRERERGKISLTLCKGSKGGSGPASEGRTPGAAGGEFETSGKSLDRRSCGKSVCVVAARVRGTLAWCNEPGPITSGADARISRKKRRSISTNAIDAKLNCRQARHDVTTARNLAAPRFRRI